MDSWTTLDNLADDFKTYLDNNYTGKIPYDPIEKTPLSLEQQDGLDRIAGLRASLYEESPDVLIRVQAGKPTDWTQAYQMQLFLRVAREDDYDYLVEKELMDFKDKAKQWADQLENVNSVASELYTFNWDSVGRIIREASFSALEINFGARRSSI